MEGYINDLYFDVSVPRATSATSRHRAPQSSRGLSGRAAIDRIGRQLANSLHPNFTFDSGVGP